MPKLHFVILPGKKGTFDKFRMKPWLREHPQEVPSWDANVHTAYQLRRALVNEGWRLETLADEVWVIKPNSKGDTSYADYALEITDRAEDHAEEEYEEITFGLEKDLQAALRRNIEQLEPGLKITDHGQEREVDAGRIDITAIDKKGQSVIIELKAGTANPDVVAQTLAYMGSVAAADGKPVRGIIVAGDFHKKVKLACNAVPNLRLKKYSFQFKFEAP